MSLIGRTAFISGGSRGIGLAIAKKFAAEKANIVLAAKTLEQHPKLSGTLQSAKQEIINSYPDAKVLVQKVDLRYPDQINDAISHTIDKFGTLDILVNNASAIEQTQNTLHVPTKKYDLINSINVRGTWLMTQSALPHLQQSTNPHVLTLSPPVNLNSKWLAIGGTAYTASKYTMSLYTLGWAEEFRGQIAFNSLWPKYIVATAAINRMLGAKGMKHSMKPEGLAEAAHIIVTKDKNEFTGNIVIDAYLMEAHGIDVEMYRSDIDTEMLSDIYVGDPDTYNETINSTSWKWAMAKQAGKRLLS